MQLRHLYLGLAIVGAAVPYAFLFSFFREAGIAPGAFLGAVFANGAAGAFTIDLVISSVAFWIFMFHRSRNGKGPAPIPFIAGNLFVGLSFALPLYLYFSERARIPA